MVFERSKLSLAVGVALLALTPFIALDQGWRYWLLVSDGVTAPALVTNVERLERRRSWFADYYATYEFTDTAGRRRTGRQEISHDLYEVLAASKSNREVTVRYCRSKPGLSAISLTSVRNEFLMFGGIAIVAVVFIFAVFLAERRENAGIVAAFRRRIQLDNSRRGPAIAGKAPHNSNR